MSLFHDDVAAVMVQPNAAARFVFQADLMNRDR